MFEPDQYPANAALADSSFFGPQTPIVVWPEHFDLSTLWFPTNDRSDEAPVMNFGFAPFDEPKVAVELRGKKPGPELEVAPATLRLDYADDFPGDDPLAAYERILLDVFHGDQLLFARADEVDRPWEVCAPLLAPTARS